MNIKKQISQKEANRMHCAAIEKAAREAREGRSRRDPPQQAGGQDLGHGQVGSHRDEHAQAHARRHVLRAGRQVPH